jgi:hypothetical protein
MPLQRPKQKKKRQLESGLGLNWHTIVKVLVAVVELSHFQLLKGGQQQI